MPRRRPKELPLLFGIDPRLEALARARELLSFAGTSREHDTAVNLLFGVYETSYRLRSTDAAELNTLIEIHNLKPSELADSPEER